MTDADTKINCTFHTKSASVEAMTTKNHGLSMEAITAVTTTTKISRITTTPSTTGLMQKVTRNLTLSMASNHIVKLSLILTIIVLEEIMIGTVIVMDKVGEDVGIVLEVT